MKEYERVRKGMANEVSPAGVRGITEQPDTQFITQSLRLIELPYALN